MTRRRLKIAISIVLIGILVWFLDVRSLAVALRDIDPALLALAFCMVIVNRILMPVKWNLLLRARGIRISHFSAIRFYTLSSFLGLVLPPTIGADSVRSYYLRNAGIALSDAVASIFIERIFGFLVLLLFTAVGFFLLMQLLQEGEVDVRMFAFAITFVAGILLAVLYVSFTPFSRNLTARVAARLQTTRFDKLARGADAFVEAYQEYRQRRPVLALFSALTAAELTLVIVRSYVVALSLGVDVELSVFFAFLPLVTLLNRMPISFDGFGINEGLFVYFLALFGVPAEKGFLIGLINHLVFIAGILPGAIFYVQSNRAGRAA